MKSIIVILISLFAVSVQAEEYNKLVCSVYVESMNNAYSDLMKADKQKDYYKASKSASLASQFILALIQDCSKMEGLNIKNLKHDLKLYIQLESKYKSYINK